MDINVNDDHTVGCAIARAADAHLSNSDDSSHNDYGSDGSGVDSCEYISYMQFVLTNSCKK